MRPIRDFGLDEMERMPTMHLPRLLDGVGSVARAGQGERPMWNFRPTTQAPPLITRETARRSPYRDSKDAL